MSIRRKVFDDIKEQIRENIDYKTFCKTIFFHPGGEALRLNRYGVKFLEQYLPCHVVEVIDNTQFKKTMPSKHYVFLSRYSKMPYYIGKQSVIFFDEDAAFLFKLCDGDIDNVKKVSD